MGKCVLILMEKGKFVLFVDFDGVCSKETKWILLIDYE